jgi:hypothetical protein
MPRHRNISKNLLLSEYACYYNPNSNAKDSLPYAIIAARISMQVVVLLTDTVETSVAKLEATARIQSLAWMIVLVSFLLFCSISISITGGIYYFFFRSSVPMDVVLQVGSGSAEIESLDQSRFILRDFAPDFLTDRPSTISTNSQSQLTISFQIPKPDGAFLLGTMTLENDSVLTLDEANIPRFDWSNGVYSVSFSNFSGEADVFIPQVADKPFELYINTPSNATFLITDTGRYTLSADATSIRLITSEGQANLLSPNRNNNRRAIKGQQAILRTGGSEPVVQDAPINLLRNGLFTFDIPEGQTYAPLGWVCENPADDSPYGSYFADAFMGRPAFRLFRQAATTTSRTGCYQEVQIDVSNYTYLELQATFALDYQSLQNCGIEGTECPMMLFITFTDAQGDVHPWYQGLFYNYLPQSTNYPLVCQGCGAGYEHLPIAEDVWFTYESGNLITRFPIEDRPEIINIVKFNAAGHQYNVFVSELALYAGSQAIPQTDQLPDTDN